MRRSLFIVVTACLLLPRIAAAQDTPRFGIVMGYPAQVGLLWNVSGRVALRPEINVTKSSNETTTSITVPLPPNLGGGTTTTTTSTSAWQFGAGASALFYLTQGDALRTYVSPRYSYGRSSNTVEGGLISSIVPIATGPTTTVSSSHTASGAIGAEYHVGQRFGVFGELGLAYQHSGATPNLASSTVVTLSQSSWTLGIRSGVGVILFF